MKCQTMFWDLGGLGDFKLDAYPDPGFSAHWVCPSPPAEGVGCSASGDAASLTFATGEPELTISVTLDFPEAFGALRVTTSTAGMKFEPSGYSVTIDAENKGPIGTDETLEFSGLRAWDHTVELVITDRPCSTVGEPVRNLTIAANETRQVEFEVFCEYEPGSIEVTTQTVGGGQDLDGYTILVDSVSQGVIGDSETRILSNIVPGDRWVELANVSANCTVVSPNRRSITVESGETVSTAFIVDCFPSGKGSLLVSTETTGSDLDPDGYEVFVGLDGRFIGVNAQEVFQSLDPGDYLVQLMGVAPNCEVNTGQFANPRTVTVSAEQVTTTGFKVTCSPWGAIRVSAETVGWDMDPDGYRVFLENTTRTSDIAIHGEHTFDLLTPGIYTVALDEDGLAKNCAVQGKNPTDPFPVGWGQSAVVPFKVRCSGIVFQGFRDGFSELYVMNADGSGNAGGPGVPDKVLSSTHDDENPAWSPDRSKIAFASDRGDGDREIYVLNLEEGSVNRLTDNSWDDDDPVWSPNGDSILYTSEPLGGQKDLYLMSANGQGNPRQITDHASGNDDQDWAPVDPLHGTAQWIVFTSSRDPDQDDELYRLNIADPSATPYQLTHNTVKDDDAVYSPDGTKIAFSRRTNGDNRDIFVMYFNGTGVVQLTTHPGDDDDPSWSPDGTMIAFMSNRDGNDEIYVMNADGSGKTRLTYHASKDDEPGWRR